MLCIVCAWIPAYKVLMCSWFQQAVLAAQTRGGQLGDASALQLVGDGFHLGQLGRLCQPAQAGQGSWFAAPPTELAPRILRKQQIRRKGHPANWTSGELESRRTGTPTNRKPGELELRRTGILANWTAGELELRRTGPGEVELRRTGSSPYRYIYIYIWSALAQ